MLLVVLVLAAPPSVRAGDEEGGEEGGGLSGGTLTQEELRTKIEQWLADLSSPEFAVREAAREGLLTHGASARDLLEARKDDEDPEVRRTVRLLLDRFGHPAPAAPTTPSGDPEALGLVTLEARGTLPYLLDLLGKEHGASFELPTAPEGLSEVFHEVALTDEPFYAALHAVLADAQLVAPGAFDAAGRLQVQAPAPGADAVPWAAAGPMRVRVVEVTSVRTLDPEGRRYMIALDLHWAPSVQVRQWQTPKDIEARDREGRAFRPGGAMRSNVTYGTSPNTRRARLNVHLEPEDEAAGEQLAVLRFTLPVTLWYDRRSLRFGPLADLELPASKAVAVTRAGDRVTLRAFDAPVVERGPHTVDLVARLTEKAAQDSLAVAIERADGSLRTANAGSRFPSADGTLALRARAWLRDEEPPVAVHVSFFRQELRGDLTFELKDVPLR